jgi:guanylate kinase
MRPVIPCHFLVLFGVPAVGKDTVTKVLEERGNQFEHFVKHKVGVLSKHGYTMITSSELVEYERAGRVVSKVERYGSVYVIDQPRLEKALAGDRIPVIHSASIDEVRTLVAIGGIVVVLECSRDTSVQRLAIRDRNTVAQRLEVWDAVVAGLPDAKEIAIGAVSTDRISPEETATIIEQLFDSSSTSETGHNAIPLTLEMRQ